jgi:hypothetical protein
MFEDEEAIAKVRTIARASKRHDLLQGLDELAEEARTIRHDAVQSIMSDNSDNA